MNSSNTEHLRSFLNGSFSLKRTISIPELTIMGEAKFSPKSQNIIEYCEDGHYFVNGAFQNFYQKQYFIFDSRVLKICNSKKEIMHKITEISSSENIYRFSHVYICKKDEYCLDWRMHDNQIDIDYKITGPLKNYFINTILEKK